MSVVIRSVEVSWWMREECLYVVIEQGFATRWAYYCIALLEASEYDRFTRRLVWSRD